MELAVNPRPDEESAVGDFTVQLFKAVKYTSQAEGRVSRTRKSLSFWASGQQKQAKTDVCIMDDSGILLLMQEDKRHMGGSDPEPQVVAEAIAVFHSNNETRVRALDLPPLTSKVIPCITMNRTMPTFYKIPATANLLRAIQLGEYPEEETVVYAHLPPVPRPARRYSEGMKPLDNRHVVLSCFEAFKSFM